MGQERVGKEKVVERSLLLQNFFTCEGEEGMSWCICFKEYDNRGYLLNLFSCRCARIRMKWRVIRDYLDNCPDNRIREVQYMRFGKTYPSMVSNGQSVRFGEPIVAKLPLFEYAKKCSAVA